MGIKEVFMVVGGRISEILFALQKWYFG